jgi:hypothetical protein
MTLEKFLQTLFEPNEQTCFASSPYDTQLAHVGNVIDSALWFSINPMHTSRADANVTSLRNFLIELDSVPLEQQIPMVREKIPVTSIVYSGGKSYHFIVSLASPAESIEEYRRIARGLFEAIPEADKSTKNPSRLSRLPFRVRPETKLNQELVYLGTRVNVNELPKAAPYHEPKEVAQNIQFVTGQLLNALHSGVDNYIQVHFSGRNQFFYWLGKRCSELGHTRDQKKQMVDKFYERLENKRNFSKREAYMAARVKF